MVVCVIVLRCILGAAAALLIQQPLTDSITAILVIELVRGHSCYESYDDRPVTQPLYCASHSDCMLYRWPATP